MDEITFPNTRRGPSSPDGAAAFAGVKIAALPQISVAGAMIVSGVYQIVEEEAARIDERLHRALVLVVTSPHCSFVTTPFQGMVLFEDDDERLGWGRRGYFNLDVFDTIARKASPEAASEGPIEIEPGEYYLMVSLGTHLSEVVRVVVG
jgi:hypothetical protein